MARRANAPRRPRRTPWRAVMASLLAGLLGLSWQLAIAQSGPDLASAEALIAEGRAAEAYEMLAPFEGDLAGDVTYDYLLARAALDSGRPSIASFIYERILAVEPNYAGVRFESGRAYLELQNYARAKQEFEQVLRFENLPPDLRTATEQYAAVVDDRLNPKRTALNTFLEYGFGYDDNVNSAIAEAAVPLPGGLTLLLDALSVQRDDTYHALNAGFEAVHSLDGPWQLFGSASVQGRLHSEETFFDYYDLNFQTGIGWVSGGHNLRASGRLGRFWIDHEPLRDIIGAGLDWTYAVNDRNQVGLYGSWTRYGFINPLLRTLDFDTTALTASWNHAFWDGKALLGLSVNGGYESETGGRLDGDKIYGGGSAVLQAALTNSIGAFVSAGVQRGVYAANNALFQVRRNDNLFTASGGVTWTFAKSWSLRPQLSWSKNDSNVALSSYDRLDISLNIRKNF